MEKITSDILLKAYMCGIFPMAESRETEDVFWVDPKKRGILPLDQFHLSKSLAKQIKKQPFEIKVNQAFDEVIEACSAPRDSDGESWINQTIVELYKELHEKGLVHTVECWQDDELVGGLYGLAIGSAFFGESMFHTKTNASKIALCYLVARLNAGGFKLLDTQFVTDHLKNFGTIEIERDEYHRTTYRQCKAVWYLKIYQY